MKVKPTINRITRLGVFAATSLSVSSSVWAYECSALNAWQSSSVYTSGTKVKHQAQAYEAKWWTQNQSPELHSGTYDVWKVLGACSGVNQAPKVAITSPAQNSILGVNDSVIIKASASDNDGSVSAVSFYVDGALLSRDDVSPFEATWSAALGEHQLTAVALDNNGATTTSNSVVVSVQEAGSNTPPILDITSPTAGEQVTVGSLVRVSANASDKDGTIKEVSFWLGEQLLARLTTAPFETTWQATQAGDVAFKAIVTDSQGATAMSTVAIKVIEAQSGGCAGLANYKAGQSYGSGQLVAHLNSKYRCEVAGWCSSNAAWAYEPGVGQHWKDAWSDVGVCATLPTVNFQAPAPDSTVLLGKATAIAVKANDADGQIRLLEVYEGTTLLSSVNASELVVDWVPTVVGQATLRAQATDNEGHQASTSQQVTVSDKVVVTSITTPTAGTRLTLGKATTIEAEATALVGAVSEVRFFANGIYLGSDTSAPYTLSYTPASLGSVTLSTQAKDTSGNETASQGVAVNVVDAPVGKTHKLIGYWHNFVNPAGCPIPLSEISPAWDVIDIAFAENDRNSSGTVHFTPFEKDIRSTCPAIDPVKFKADVKALQAQGKVIVLSLGGAEGTITLNSDSDEANFVASLTQIIKEWGFDGLDIDLESGSNLVHGSQIQARLPRALKKIEQNIGGDMYLTMAPEHPYVHGGMIAYSGIWGAYIPLIDQLRDTLDLLHVQLYNNGGLPNPYEAGSAPEGSVNMMVAHAKMLVEGFTLANGQSFAPLRDDQVAIGLPSGPKSANSGQAPIANIVAALDCLTKGTKCGTIVPSKTYPQFGGVMTWSINWDKFDGYNFSKPIGDKLSSMNQVQ
jgi:chitinase